MLIVLTSRRLVNTCAIAIALLLGAHTAAKLLILAGYSEAKGFIPTFDMNAEGNVPTFVSGLGLLAAAGLFALIARHRQGEAWARHWAVLALVFLFLSFDEAAQIHERLTHPVRVLVGASGLLFFAWVIPYLVFATALAIVFIPFLVHLPRGTRFLVCLAGGVYLLGAVGFEMVGAREYEIAGDSWRFSLFATVEELMEMLGIALLLYAQLSYVEAEMGQLSICVGSRPEARLAERQPRS